MTSVQQRGTKLGVVGAGLVENRGQSRPSPLLYQINTRIRLRERSDELDRPATLDDITDAELDRLAELGFDWVWFLGVWRTGEAGRRVARLNAEWRREFLQVLPDLTEDDICGSCFAVTGYEVHPDFGGDAALGRLRSRLRKRGLRLMLDFVPNHMALDHSWVHERPELFVQGSDAELASQPRNYVRLETKQGTLIIAHGRDPNFPGWPDTVQLNYGNPATQRAMQEQLLAIAGLCDGVRCDMAMLLLPEVFQRTWQIAMAPFWPDAIKRIRQRHPDFVFMAEVYWDLEWSLQQQGFDFTYDKRLYDRLSARTAPAVSDHLRADLDYQRKLARFLENHDEPRAASSFPWEIHQAAAVVTFLSPGLRFFHHGQFDGRLKRIPVHLARAPAERPDPAILEFYERLLRLLREDLFRSARWRLLDPVEAWPGNWTWNGFIAFLWEDDATTGCVVVVNYQPNQGQCHLPLPCPGLSGRQTVLADTLGTASYERDGDELMSRGLYLDMPAWGYHAFALRVGAAAQVSPAA